MAFFNSTIGQDHSSSSIDVVAAVSSSSSVLVIGGLGAETTTTSVVVSDVVESSVESLFQWATVAESSTFGLIWLTAVIGNGLITCTLLRRGLLTHPSNRFVHHLMQPLIPLPRESFFSGTVSFSSLIRIRVLNYLYVIFKKRKVYITT